MWKFGFRKKNWINHRPTNHACGLVELILSEYVKFKVAKLLHQQQLHVTSMSWRFQNMWRWKIAKVLFGYPKIIICAARNLHSQNVGKMLMFAVIEYSSRNVCLSWVKAPVRKGRKQYFCVSIIATQRVTLWRRDGWRSHHLQAYLDYTARHLIILSTFKILLWDFSTSWENSLREISSLWATLSLLKS